MRPTGEQREAIADRRGSRLLSASAGSGKTAVMVERFVAAVVEDGVPVGSILAITFTEKAAGELRERIRRRFAELGRHDDARAGEGAWIGTIHSFCARVLRTRPLSAGLDPRFRVFDEPAATRLARGAFERALEAWVAEAGDPAVELAAAYGVDALRDMVAGAHAAQRSSGQTRPTLPDPQPGADPSATRAALARAAARAASELSGLPTNGQRVAEALDALESCRDVVDGGGDVPLPPSLAGLDVGRGATALRSQACEAYRDALSAHRDACADHHAAPAVVLLRALLEHFDAAYTALKRGGAAAGAGVDFADLELLVRDLLAGDPALARRWRERFELIMVDEFQDTNRVQLELLSALEREPAAPSAGAGKLFAVGDEFQAIYGFRHADVEIFRERRAALGAGGNRRLTANFRSAPELLELINATYAPLFGAEFAPLVPGGREEELRLFDPGAGAGEPAAELLITAARGWEDHEPGLGLALPGAPCERRAEARLVAQRLRDEVDAGRSAGEMVVLVRATASLGLFEQALEEAGLPTYVVGGRGYWAQEQVRDGLAYLRALANPLDEEALYAVLASPFCGVGSDALVLVAEAGRRGGGGAWAALREGAAGDGLGVVPPAELERLRAFARFLAGERLRAPRLPLELLLERAVSHTGYDLAVLARGGGERRLANLRKLMRLARTFEAIEGRDLRGFVAYAGAQDLAQAREGEAALEAEDLDAVRLMTIHRAKGLEFPLVCVADLGRSGQAAHPALLADGDRVGLRLRTAAGGKAVPALAHRELAEERERAEAEEERRLLYVAMTRARERLLVSGACDLERAPAERHGGAPLAWLLPAMLGGERLDAERPDRVVDAGGARLRLCVNAPETVGDVLRALRPEAGQEARAVREPTPARDAQSEAPSCAPGRGAAAPRRLSYSQLSAHARCGYRFYLERVLGLPPVAPPPAAVAAAAAEGEPALDPRVRGSLVHKLLEDLSFAGPAVPGAEAIEHLAHGWGAAVSPDDVRDIQGLIASFAESPLRERLAAARDVRREAPFAFLLDPPDRGPLVTGFIDVLAEESVGARLVVDYKTDRLDDADPHEVVEREYAVQRAVYALAALRDGAQRVEVAYAFLDRPDALITADFEDPEDLSAMLASAARGIVEEDWSVTPKPYRELCADCPGRPRLCSYGEELTLRPRPQAPGDYASAGSLTGSGGPS